MMSSSRVVSLVKLDLVASFAVLDFGEDSRGNEQLVLFLVNPFAKRRNKWKLPIKFTCGNTPVPLKLKVLCLCKLYPYRLIDLVPQKEWHGDHTPGLMFPTSLSIF
ncbi:hypothetical protein V6N11_068103 [Hibiscus sabdariffa]|uniref:Uncharacterized protein n=1 Tax=Hibiscus sabdariffa TaxID=183260 RepID=A0ABR2STH2_9ROSI